MRFDSTEEKDATESKSRRFPGVANGLVPWFSPQEKVRDWTANVALTAQSKRREAT